MSLPRRAEELEANAVVGRSSIEVVRCSFSAKPSPAAIASDPPNGRVKRVGLKTFGSFGESVTRKHSPALYLLRGISSKTLSTNRISTSDSLPSRLASISRKS